MAVKTNITLQELNYLFISYEFVSLEVTNSGIIDTTYFVSTKDEKYILKHYERDVDEKVFLDASLMSGLKSIGLNVPTLVDKKNGWYIYEKLSGDEPTHIQLYHIKALASFLARMHNFTDKKSLNTKFINKLDINNMLIFLKQNSFAKYKKYSYLKYKEFKTDGIIHGDIFKDNTVFDGKRLGVFDFVDSGDGSFSFDAGVTLFGFGIDVKQKLFINIFLNVYNQKAKYKLTKKELLENIKLAADFYTLKRLCR